METNEKTTAYGIARRRLLERISELSKAGHRRIPGLRELCKDLDVSFMTANKVVQSLAKEGRLQIIPRKGNFIVDAPRRFEVAVAIVGSTSCTFLKDPLVLRGVLDAFDKLHCFLRILHLPEPAKAKSFLADYKIDACLWYLPEPDCFDDLKTLSSDLSIPLIPVVQSLGSASFAELPPLSFVVDYSAVGRARANFLLERGHRKIARLNCDDFKAPDKPPLEYSGFVSAISASGLVYDRALSVAPDLAFTRIPEILDRGLATAAVVNGGELQMQRVFQIVDGHENAGNLELLVDNIGSYLPKLAAEFPNVKIAGVNSTPGYRLGFAAAKALSSFLLEGRQISSLKVPSEICALDELDSKLF